MGKINYDALMIREGEKANGEKKLLMHACCAPCSSYCFEETSKFFDVTLYFYNPNMDTAEEYEKRREELKKLAGEFFPNGKKAATATEEYEPKEFYERVKGYENEPEGGARCEKCFELRLEKTAAYAKEHGFDYFTTTLTVSPHKNAEKINAIGEKIGQKYGVKYLYSDFKKRDGFKRSTALSEEFGLYRQNYCGCVFSKRMEEILKKS